MDGAISNMPKGKSYWWNPRQEMAGSLQAIFETFNAYAIPFFEQLTTRGTLLETDWKRFPRSLFALDRISEAAIHAGQGNIGAAERSLVAAYRDCESTNVTAGCQEFVLQAAERIGLSDEIFG